MNLTTRAVRTLCLGILLGGLGFMTAGCGKPCRDVGLYTIRADGSDHHRVPLDDALVERETDFSNYVANATWLPGGNRIAFRDGCTWWAVNPDGSEILWPPHNPTFAVAGVRLSWIPPTARPTKVGGISIPPNVPGFTIFRPGSSIKKVLFHPGFEYDTDSCVGAPFRALEPQIAPRISADGSSVVYVDDVDRRRDYSNLELFSVSTRGAPPRRLTWSYERDEMAPTWSPDGRRIAFVREWLVRGVSTDTWHYAVYVMNADGSQQRMVSPTAESVAWSPDGSALVIQRDREAGDGEELVVVDLEGRVIQQLTTGNLFVYSVSWAPAETIAYVEDKGDDSQDKCGS